MSDHLFPRSRQPNELVKELEKLTVRILTTQHELHVLEAMRDRVRQELLRAAVSPATAETTVNRVDPATRPVDVLNWDTGNWHTNTIGPRILKFGSFKWAEEPTPGEKATADVIRDAGLTVDKEWLAKRLGITAEAATIRLSRAAQKGLLARTGRGLYFAPPKQPQDEARDVVLGFSEEPSSEPPREQLGLPKKEPAM